jgi:glycerophosphoryl diester phosphodiesterase
MEKLVAEVLKNNGLDQRGGDGKTPVLMQSFSKAGLLRLRERGVDQPVLWLAFAGTKDLTGVVSEARKNKFESIGPFKNDITPDIMKQTHAAGLKMIPYTFEPSAVEKRFPSLKAEMSYYLYELGIDGMFTNNPDVFPREKI